MNVLPSSSRGRSTADPHVVARSPHVVARSPDRATVAVATCPHVVARSPDRATAAVAACLLLFVCGLLLAADAEPDFTAYTASSAPQAGSLEVIGPAWAVRLGGDKPARVAADELLALRRRGTKLPDVPGPEQAILAGGDRLPGEAIDL